MLVLHRRSMETLQLTTGTGEVITLTVVQVKGGQVKLGIDAPGSVHILRGELVKPPTTNRGDDNAA